MTNNLKIGEAVWYVEQCGNAYPTIEIGLLVDFQKDKALLHVGRQDFGMENKYYEDIVWTNPIIDTYPINEYEKAKEKLNIFVKEYEAEIKKKEQRE